MRPALPAAVAALVASAVIAVAPAPTVTAVDDVIAFDMVGSTSQNLISFTNNAPAFSSAGDAFGKLQRGVSTSIPFSIADDSVAGFPGDALGVIDETNVDEFFGITDTVNGDTSGPVTASWVFDIAGSSDLGLSVAIGAMGDFESTDTFVFSASIDGGSPDAVITAATDEAGFRVYTLAGGAEFNLNDPLNVGAVPLSNVLSTVAAPIAGSGSELTITITAQTDGGSEAFAFQNLEITSGSGGGSSGAAPGDLVITEIMQNPNAVFDSDGEWFEVTNVTGADIDLAGWTIRDDGSDSQVVAASVIVPAGGTAVLGNNTDTGTNGGATVDYDYGSMFLSNSADELVLVEPGGVIVDYVAYDNGATFPDPNGASMSLDPASTDATANDDGSNWCEASGAFGAGDLGTPGAANPTCTAPPPPLVKIHEVQGSGSSVAITTPVQVEGIVTSLFTRDDALDGFFLQEEDADADADASTSEGIFVFCRGNCPAVTTADLVMIEGLPADFFGMSQINLDSATIVGSGNPLPSATSIALPVSGSTMAAPTFEPTEGMLVTFPGTLAVSEYFALGRYGQVVLTDAARPYQYTHHNAPSVDGYAAFLAGLETRRIILDDDNNDQNDATSDGPDEVYYHPTGGLSLTNKFRGGDTISGLTGVLHWSFAGQTGTDAWRVRPVAGVDYSFEPANPGQAEPDDVGGSISAASFNVLNLFSTIDEGSSICGPSGDQGCRGADSVAELTRQRAKIAAAIAAIDASIVGLIEMENDTNDRSVSELVDAVNAIAGAGTYDFVATGAIGDDAIKVGLIYKPTQVTPVGDYALLDGSVDPRFIDSKNRPVLIQTFVENSTAAQVTVAVNHLKSKGSSCDDVGDPGTGDGQANCAGTRTMAAEAIADYLATDPTGSGDADFLVLGDLNSYAMEDPITALKSAGYTDLLAEFVGPDAYTYVFDGQLGYLDYALSNDALTAQVTGATAWHINADEIPIFDYNDEIRDGSEASFHRESGVLPVYAADPLRASDHDPVIVGLDLVTDYEGVIDGLVDQIAQLKADGDLNKGQARSLERSLAQALRQIDRDKHNGARGILSGVLAQLNDFVDDGILTDEQAEDIVVLVTAVRTSIS